MKRCIDVTVQPSAELKYKKQRKRLCKIDKALRPDVSCIKDETDE